MDTHVTIAGNLTDENVNARWPHLARLKWPHPLVVCR
jgi:hypothetical protein